MKGSDFLALHSASTPDVFEAAVLADKSSWITWPVVEVALDVPGHAASIFVSSDYFAVGEGSDVLYCPLSAPSAQVVADACSAILPTTKIVDLVWAAATAKLKPITAPEIGIALGQDQMSVRAFGVHSAAVRQQLGLFFPNSETLIAGNKKDIVISNRLEQVDASGHGGPSRACIYGWHRLDGVPIQPQSTIHERTYRDYSHGLRLVFETMLFDGVTIAVAEMLGSKRAGVLSYEGPMRVLRQPALPVATATLRPASMASSSVRTLRLGSRGPDVAVWQHIVGVSPQTEYFGPVTLAATKAWQLTHHLAADGVVGTETWRASRGIDVLPSSSPMEPDLHRSSDIEGLRFVQARHCTHLTTSRNIKWIVLHTMEIAEKGDTAEACAAYFAATDRLASAHFCVDANSAVQCVSLGDVAFGAPGANREGVHIEHAGFARQTAEEWDDDYSRAMLVRSAALVEQILSLIGARFPVLTGRVPSVYVDAEDLLAGRPGVTTHYQCTLAGQIATQRHLTSSSFYGRGAGGHVDPGPSFPMDGYLADVHRNGLLLLR